MMVNELPDSLAVVEIHTSGTPYIAWGGQRAGFYGVGGTPVAWFDGVLECYGAYTNVTQQYNWYMDQYNARQAVYADVTIALTADPVDAQTTSIHANVCIEAGGTGKTMRIYMVQVLDNDDWGGLPSYARNTLRAAASSTQDITLAPGECEEVVRSFTFESSPSWQYQEDIKIIAWAQEPESSAPAEVYQAAVMGWPFTAYNLPCDFDDNGRINESDAIAFLACYSGDGIPHPPGCEEGDTEPDGDVDCDDWEVLKSIWTPLPPDYPPFFITCDDDCNGNSVADEWDIDAGTSEDCNSNESPDECEIPVSSGGFCTVDCDPDCNENAVPDECDITGPTSEDCQPNGVPDECDISSGTSPDDNTNDIPDECEIYPPLAEDCGAPCEAGAVPCVDDGDCAGQARCVGAVCYAPKHRYVSIAHNPDQVTSTARRVKLDSGEILGWVGEPSYVEPAPHHDGLCLAGIVAEPYYTIAWGCYSEDPPYSIDVVEVTGCKISTDQTYDVQAIGYGFDIGDEMYYSDVLMLPTASAWGDTVGACAGNTCTPADGIVGLPDIMAAISKFQGNDVAPVTWLDLSPSSDGATPDQNIGLGDIMSCIGGYQGDLYPGPVPLDCP